MTIQDVIKKLKMDVKDLQECRESDYLMFIDLGGDEELEASKLIIEALEAQEREEWHPINPDDPDSFPDNDRLVLVSFQNTERMDVARYRKSTDGGAFYPADTSLPYVSLGLFVSAWKECYCYAQGADFERAEEPFPDPLIMDESGAFTE